MLLFGKLIVVDKVEGAAGGRGHAVGVDTKDYAVVALRANDPDRQLRLLETFADLEVAIVLKQRQEADLALRLNTLENEVVTQVSVAVVHVGPRSARQHQVDDLLRRIPVLVDQGAPGQVHVGLDVLDASSQDDRVHKKDNALTILLIEA